MAVCLSKIMAVAWVAIARQKKCTPAIRSSIFWISATTTGAQRLNRSGVGGGCADRIGFLQPTSGSQPICVCMSSDSTSAVQPPHDYMDAMMTVEGLSTSADEEKLTSTLNELRGVRTVTIAGANVSVEYDPVEVSKHEIGETLALLGFKVVDVETAAASPIFDALHGNQ
jgi:copper chaperone CopZ